MGNIVVVGAQWGDEGKGKVVDHEAQDAHAVVRYQGGANAGHTLVVRGETTILHLIPSGALNPYAQVVLADGMLNHFGKLRAEEARLPASHSLEGRLHISKLSSVVTPYQIAEDVRRELSNGGIGSTKNGMGPCAEDIFGKRGLMAGHLLENRAMARHLLEKQKAHWRSDIPVDIVLDELLRDVEPYGDVVKMTGPMISQWYADGKKIVFEGAQGGMLDPKTGSYPYVTSTYTGANGIGVGIGAVVPLDRIIGIVKLTKSKVGDGPFPTELVDETRLNEEFMAEVYAAHPRFDSYKIEDQNSARKEVSETYKLTSAERQIVQDPMHPDYQHVSGKQLGIEGGEFGAKTGRPRRMGHLDAAVVKHVAGVNGLTGLALTKLDCLGGIERLSVAVGYEGHNEFPLFNLDTAVPIYETMPGWQKEEVAGARRWDDLPGNAQAYVRRIEELVGVPVQYIGTGQNRKDLIVL